MVGAPQVDHPVEAPLEFVLVVGDIRGKVGGYPVVPDHHPVFIISESRGSEPLGSVFLIHIAFFLELVHHLVDLVRIVETLFAEPHVEFTVECFQVFLQGRQFFFLGQGLELFQPFFFRHMDELVPVFGLDPPGGHFDVFPMVSVFRELAGNVE